MSFKLEVKNYETSEEMFDTMHDFVSAHRCKLWAYDDNYTMYQSHDNSVGYLIIVRCDNTTLQYSVQTIKYRTVGLSDWHKLVRLYHSIQQDWQIELRLRRRGF